MKRIALLLATAMLLALFAGCEKKNETPLVTEDTPLSPETVDTVLFIGNSYTYFGNTPQHFAGLSNYQIKTKDLSKGGYLLEWHIDWILENPDECNFEEVDVVVLQEFGGSFPDIDTTQKLMEIIGTDKKYYAFMPFYGPSIDGSETCINHAGNIKVVNTNEQLREKKAEFHDIGVSVVYTGGIFPYNPEFKESDFHVNDLESHPTELNGYCIALALYCTIFNEKTVDQNNGYLVYRNIPGETLEEKDAYMVKVKETVQYILDIQ